jgi:hypothetical protein
MRLTPLAAGPLLAGLLFAALPATADAQRDEVYRGMSLAFGFGRGSMAIECKGCETSAQADISGLARVGWTLRENVIVAVEGIGFQKAQVIDQRTVDATFTFGGAVLLWYPRRYADFFLKVGGGMSHSSGTFNAQTGIPTELELNSPALLLGVGTDLRIGRTFSVSPFVDYYRPVPRDADLGGGAAISITSSTFNFGLALTYH